jgi:hypothetical protein
MNILLRGFSSSTNPGRRINKLPGLMRSHIDPASKNSIKQINKLAIKNLKLDGVMKLNRFDLAKSHNMNGYS